MERNLGNMISTFCSFVFKEVETTVETGRLLGPISIRYLQLVCIFLRGKIVAVACPVSEPSSWLLFDADFRIRLV